MILTLLALTTNFNNWKSTSGKLEIYIWKTGKCFPMCTTEKHAFQKRLTLITLLSGFGKSLIKLSILMQFVFDSLLILVAPPFKNTS